MAAEKSKSRLLEFYKAYDSLPFIECYDHIQDHPVAYGLTDYVMGEDTVIMVLIKPDASREAVLGYLCQVIEHVKNDENWQRWNDFLLSELGEVDELNEELESKVKYVSK